MYIHLYVLTYTHTHRAAMITLYQLLYFIDHTGSNLIFYLSKHNVKNILMKYYFDFKEYKEMEGMKERK